LKEKVNITIHDLAKEMSLSPSTISRALKDHPSIGAKTRLAVQKLAKLRGYRPNIMAVNLRSQKSKTIGVLLSFINRPFNSALISGVEEAARAIGYNVIISQTTDNLEIEKNNLRALYDMRICGLISSLSIETLDFEHFDQFHRSSTPVVFVDRVPVGYEGYKVIIDNFKAGYDASTHLIEQGCKKLGHIGGSIKQQLYKDRRDGFVQAIVDARLPVDERIILNGKNLSREEGTQMAKEILQIKGVDGLFCANDASAVSALMVAKELSIAVPDDLAIMGFNNDPICLVVDPPLSSLFHPGYEMGKLCVKKLMEAINEDSSSPKEVTLSTELKIRKSSLRKNKFIHEK